MSGTNDAIEFAKGIVSVVAGIGASQVVMNVVEATLPPEAKIFTKIATTIGGAVIGGIAAKAAGDYVDDTVDSVIELVDNMTSEDKEDELKEWVTP